MSHEIAWTPREVKALREAQHLSQRAFANRLGYAHSTVANWEKTTRSTADLHHETREVLGRELGRLSDDLRERFDRLLNVASSNLGAGSASRTSTLLGSLHVNDSPLRYSPPVDVVDDVRTFLAASGRVFLLRGAAGTGKSHLTHYLSHSLSDQADFQLLTVSNWDLAAVDIAVEILRYAAISRGHDALLTLEQHAQSLSRPCVVVIDGISSHDEFAIVGRQVDAILRQVTTSSLRFLLTVRTPPAVETTAYPLLHATLFKPAEQARSGRTELMPWPLEKARRRWDEARGADVSPFGCLPAGIQHLVRTPVYMRLALTASLETAERDLNAYALLDRCVRTIISSGNTDPELAIPALTELARKQGYLPSTISSSNGLENRPSSPVPPLLASTLVHGPPHGRVEFTHEVLREFFLSTYIADKVYEYGRSVVAVTTLNELAARASTSGSVRSVLDLIIQRLDDRAPDLLEYVATVPTSSVSTTVPALMAMADGSRFARPEVLRGVAKRAEQERSIELCRALLSSAVLHKALGLGRTRWLLALLREFGTNLWSEITGFIERTFDAGDAYSLLDAADSSDGDEAVFFARHFYLFFSETTSETLAAFIGHPNWRVRAALASGISDERVPVDTRTMDLVDQLVHDADYKVRAAIAPTVPSAPAAAAKRYLTTLLADENWYVRERMLRGLESLGPGHPRRGLVHAALEVMSNDPAWRRCPRHILPSWQRLEILHNSELAVASTTAHGDDGRALLTVLRESRTGYLALPQSIQRTVMERAQRSDSWLVRHELAGTADYSQGAEDDRNPRLSRERFRRARGHRAVQIALDMRDIDDAIAVARSCAQAGADYIEIGDPLIKEVGISAIEQVKAAVPTASVVAEMMSADWGRDQVVLAAQTGADVVLLIGPATTASVSAAVEAGQRLGVPILLDTPVTTSQRWVTDMERVGVDGFTITTNIDLGIGNTTALDAARTLRSWTQLPVAVSGGFSATDDSAFTNPDWDILIVGRSVADATDPASAASRILELAHSTERHS
ncbi:orotidine 5'-phosphate decarboxylase / HUMPS family protein [Actinopolyspora halophila]|uniref:orotidine 5'-phosphate decarboxylase / HUMPS family protein n=1 Tax=Actinopolyspora halophila TaxID=1850 RepID=UPI000374B6C4|nr:orotidine 5'-phosphate decarboxylase / HUMPS family protein [Actinopolyspora halophila]